MGAVTDILFNACFRKEQRNIALHIFLGICFSSPNRRRADIDAYLAGLRYNKAHGDEPQQLRVNW